MRGQKISIYYKLTAAIQQMGCGYTDVATLAGFLDIPATWTSVVRYMKGVESVMEPF